MKETKANKFGRYNSVFARNLRQLLEENKVTHETVAKAVGVTRQAFGKWVNGETLPDIDKAAGLADFFKVSVDYLLGLSNIRSLDTNSDMKIAGEWLGLSEMSLKEIKRYSKLLENILPLGSFLAFLDSLKDVIETSSERAYFNKCVVKYLSSERYYNDNRELDITLRKAFLECALSPDLFLFDCHIDSYECEIEQECDLAEFDLQKHMFEIISDINTCEEFQEVYFEKYKEKIINYLLNEVNELRILLYDDLEETQKLFGEKRIEDLKKLFSELEKFIEDFKRKEKLD